MFAFLKAAPSTSNEVAVVTSSPSAPIPLKYYGTLVLGSQQYPIRDTVGTIRYSGHTLSYSVLSSNNGDNGAGLRLVWTPAAEANPDALTSISSLNASLKHIRAALEEANNQLISLSSSSTTDESTIAAIGRLFIHRSSLENELKTLLQKKSLPIECPEAQIFNLPSGLYCSITFDTINKYNNEKNGKTEIIDEKKSQIKGILALWAPFLSSAIKDNGFSEIVQVPIIYKKSLNIFELERQSSPFINEPEKSKFFAEPNKGLQSVLNYIANNAINKNKKQIKSFHLAGSWTSSTFVVGNLFVTCGNKPFFVVIKHSNGTIFGCFVPQSLADACYTPLDPDTLLFSISADGELRAILKAFENEKDHHHHNNNNNSDGRQIFLGSGCGLHLGIPTGYDNDLSLCINHSGSGGTSIHGSCNPHVFKYMVDGNASLSEISSSGFLTGTDQPNFNAEIIETFTVHFDTE